MLKVNTINAALFEVNCGYLLQKMDIAIAKNRKIPAFGCIKYVCSRVKTNASAHDALVSIVTIMAEMLKISDLTLLQSQIQFSTNQLLLCGQPEWQ